MIIFFTWVIVLHGFLPKTKEVVQVVVPSNNRSLTKEKNSKKITLYPWYYIWVNLIFNRYRICSIILLAKDLHIVWMCLLKSFSIIIIIIHSSNIKRWNHLMKIRFFLVCAARPLDDNIGCLTPSSHAFFNGFLINQLWKKSSHKSISYKHKRIQVHNIINFLSFHKHLE